jgi:hemoglobin-like flavoprotein
MVSECLIDALSVVAGEAWKPEMTVAWKAALEAISDIMIEGHGVASRAS